jgi:hypothetical protein
MSLDLVNPTLNIGTLNLIKMEIEKNSRKCIYGMTEREQRRVRKDWKKCSQAYRDRLNQK